jgi:hypothetical protein
MMDFDTTVSFRTGVRDVSGVATSVVDLKFVTEWIEDSARISNPKTALES